MKPRREFLRSPEYLESMRHFIPEAIKTLGRARPRDLERFFKETFAHSVTDDTLRKYADLLVDEGLLRREVIIDNRDDETTPAQRRYRMVWYMLR